MYYFLNFYKNIKISRNLCINYYGIILKVKNKTTKEKLWTRIK